MCRPVRTGEDLPSRTGVLQTRFLPLLNSTGKPVSVETPEPFGPRKRVHSCAVTGKANRKNASKKGRPFIVLPDDAREPPGQYINKGYQRAQSGSCCRWPQR